mmetsp:Transcript_9116/g.13324  ORF Transcript_9116/g.13324 Transcript_9116/m.13324 type:complete len:112 (-) Transcript_9116:1974-2309(-)
MEYFQGTNARFTCQECRMRKGSCECANQFCKEYCNAARSKENYFCVRHVQNKNPLQFLSEMMAKKKTAEILLANTPYHFGTNILIFHDARLVGEWALGKTIRTNSVRRFFK